MGKRYLVTAGLPYSNGRLHVGHIGGAYLPADTYVRYLRATGHEALFICGSDDNGVAIEISAAKQGITPQEVSSKYNALQKADFDGLRIDFDVFGGTHQPHYQPLHEQLSQEFFKNIHDKGYFTKKTTKQLYDAQADRFLPDRYVKGICNKCGAETFGDQCNSCGAIIDALLLKDPVSTITGTPAEVRETTHWYLRLNEFEQPLTEWLESKRGTWRTSVLNFTLGQIKQGLPERAMTRDISWGIPVPLDDPDAEGKVLFVWFDAPIGYVSFTAQLLADRGDDPQSYRDWWASDDCDVVHFIGEDNTVFHALIWPAMLMADDRHSLPSQVVANNFINIRLGGGEEKVSKSQTPEESPVWIAEFRKHYDPDALRYYLTSIAPETSRTAFDPEDFVARNNSELVGTFGNFVNRTLQFAGKYFEGKIPSADKQTDADRTHLELAAGAFDKVGAHLAEHRYRQALEEMMNFARACNEHFSERAPWASRKEDMDDCAGTIATCIHSVHTLARLCQPFMPGASEKILAQLNVEETVSWQAPEPLPTGHALGEAQILFAKLENAEGFA